MTSQTGTLSPDGVRTMFDRIAPVYDLMNRLMTAGLDQRWRRMTAAAAVRPGDRVLDACCGTGDLAVAAQAAGGRVTGLDFSEKMLERARRKSSSIEWMRGDLLELPFEDASFDAATVGFGVRNVADLERGLGELARVRARAAASGSWRSRSAWPPATVLQAWFDGSSPRREADPGGAAYRTCPPASGAVPGPDELAGLLARTGFEEVRYRLLAGGIVALHTGRRRDD
jgi:demethylmenaquinone methyltransferase/2-methoxy-6-polyprenyl-1,4-benzoquinol methylase